MTNKRFGFALVIALLAGVGTGLIGNAQPVSPLSPPERHNAAAVKYPRGRVGHPMLAASLASAPKLDFPNVTLAAYDSRTAGMTPPFRNQQQCGSCWDFSGIRTIAYARAKYNLNPFQLSEQYILDCVPSGGCNGDDNTTVLKAAKADGIPSDDNYTAYHGRAGRCSGAKQPFVKIKDWVLVDGDNYDRPGATQKIKNAVYATGAVGCAVAASSSWDGYSGGVHQGHSRQIDHDVVITGWQDDPSIPGGGWWWMDNSWGESWGEGGRMKIAYGADMIGTEPVAVILDAPPPPPVPPAPPVGATTHWVLIVVGGVVVALALFGGGVLVGYKIGKPATA